MNHLHPPAQCGSCGHIHEATEYGMSHVFNASFTGMPSKCPRCGSRSRVVEGSFATAGDSLRLLSGPESTLEILNQLARTIRDSVAAGETPEQTADRISEIAPWLAGVKQFAKGHAVSFMWTALGVIASYEYNQYRDSLTAADKREQQITAVQEGIQRDREAQQWLEFKERMKEPLPARPSAAK